jgi:hypothetical protein
LLEQIGRYGSDWFFARHVLFQLQLSDDHVRINRS